MRSLPLVVLIVLAIAVTACGGAANAPTPTSTSGAPVGGTVTLGQRSFVEASITITTGQALRIVDPADTGGNHMLCLGKDGQCDSGAQGPDALRSPGEAFHPGDSKAIPFLSAGQYQITCTIHPRMSLVVSVLGAG